MNQSDVGTIKQLNLDNRLTLWIYGQVRAKASASEGALRRLSTSMDDGWMLCASHRQPLSQMADLGDLRFAPKIFGEFVDGYGWPGHRHESQSHAPRRMPEWTVNFY